MAIFSTLFGNKFSRKSLESAVHLIKSNPKCRTMILREMSGGHGPEMMPITPSRWQWHKFKDLMHFYGMVGLIPATIVVFCANVFIGPAQLESIPEGYTPKHWEYHKHPLTRLLAQYVFANPQQEYEKFMHALYEENERAQLRKLEQQIKEKMQERQDYKAYYYRPVIAKYHRASKEAADELEALRGD